MTNWVKLKFAAMNLKKLATRKWKECFIYPCFFEPFSSFLNEIRL